MDKKKRNILISIIIAVVVAILAIVLVVIFAMPKKKGDSEGPNPPPSPPPAEVKNLTNEQLLSVLTPFEDMLLNFKTSRLVNSSAHPDFDAPKNNGEDKLSRFDIDDAKFLDNLDGSGEIFKTLTDYFPNLYMYWEEIKAQEDATNKVFYGNEDDLGMENSGIENKLFISSATEEKIEILAKYFYQGKSSTPAYLKLVINCNEDLDGFTSLSSYILIGTNSISTIYLEVNEENKVEYGYLSTENNFSEYNILKGKKASLSSSMQDESSKIEEINSQILSQEIKEEITGYKTTFDNTFSDKTKVKVVLNGTKEAERDLTDDEIKGILSKYTSFTSRFNSQGVAENIFVGVSSIESGYSIYDIPDSEFENYTEDKGVLKDFYLQLFNIFSEDVYSYEGVFKNAVFYAKLNGEMEAVSSFEDSVKLMVVKATDKEVVLNILFKTSSLEAGVKIRLVLRDLSSFSKMYVLFGTKNNKVSSAVIDFNDDGYVTNIVTYFENSLGQEGNFKEINYLAGKISQNSSTLSSSQKQALQSVYGKYLTDFYVGTEILDIFTKKLTPKTRVEVVYPKITYLTKEQILSVLSPIQKIYPQGYSARVLQDNNFSGTFFDFDVYAKKEDVTSNYSKLGIEDGVFEELDSSAYESLNAYIAYFLPTIFYSSEELSALDTISEIVFYQNKALTYGGGVVDYSGKEYMYIESATSEQIVLYTKSMASSGGLTVISKIVIDCATDLTGPKSMTAYTFMGDEGVGVFHYDFNEQNLISNFYMCSKDESNLSLIEYNFVAGKKYNTPLESVPQNVTDIMSQILPNEMQQEISNYGTQFDTLTSGKLRKTLASFPDDLRNGESKINDEKIKNVLTKFFDFTKLLDDEEPDVYAVSNGVLENYSKLNLTDDQFNNLDKSKAVDLKTFGLGLLNVFAEDFLAYGDALQNALFLCKVDLDKQPVESNEDAAKLIVSKASDKEIILNFVCKYEGSSAFAFKVVITLNETQDGFTSITCFVASPEISGGKAIIYFDESQKITHIVYGAYKEGEATSIAIKEENYLANKEYFGEITTGTRGEGAKELTKDDLKNMQDTFGTGFIDLTYQGVFRASLDKKINLREDQVEVAYPKVRDLSNEEILGVIEPVQDVYLKSLTGNIFNNLIAPKESITNNYSKFGVEDTSFENCSDNDAVSGLREISSLFFGAIFYNKDGLAKLDKLTDIVLYENKAAMISGKGLDYTGKESIYIESATTEKIVINSKTVFNDSIEEIFVNKTIVESNFNLTGCKSFTINLNNNGKVEIGYFEFDENNLITYFYILSEESLIEYNLVAGKYYDSKETSLPLDVTTNINKVLTPELKVEISNYPAQFETLTSEKQTREFNSFPDDLKENERQLSDTEIKNVLSPFFDFIANFENEEPDVFAPSNESEGNYSKLGLADDKFEEKESQSNILNEKMQYIIPFKIFASDVIEYSGELMKAAFYSMVGYDLKPVEHENNATRLMVSKASENEIILNLYENSNVAVAVRIAISCNEKLDGFDSIKIILSASSFQNIITFDLNENKKITHLICFGNDSGVPLCLREINYLANKEYSGVMGDLSEYPAYKNQLTIDDLKNMQNVFGENLSDITACSFLISDGILPQKMSLREDQVEVVYPKVRDLSNEEILRVIEPVQNLLSDMYSATWFQGHEQSGLYFDLNIIAPKQEEVSSGFSRFGVDDSSFNDTTDKESMQALATYLHMPFPVIFYNKDGLAKLDNILDTVLYENKSFMQASGIDYTGKEYMYIENATEEKIVFFNKTCFNDPSPLEFVEKMIFECNSDLTGCKSLTVNLTSGGGAMILYFEFDENNMVTYFYTCSEDSLEEYNFLARKGYDSSLGDSALPGNVTAKINEVLTPELKGEILNYSAEYETLTSTKQTREFNSFPDDLKPDERALTDEETKKVLSPFFDFVASCQDENLDVLASKQDSGIETYSKLGFSNDLFTDISAEDKTSVLGLLAYIEFLAAFKEDVLAYDKELMKTTFYSMVRYDLSPLPSSKPKEEGSWFMISKASDREIILDLYTNIGFDAICKITLTCNENLDGFNSFKFELSLAGTGVYYITFDLNENQKITYLTGGAYSSRESQSMLILQEINYLADKMYSAKIGDMESEGQTNELTKEQLKNLEGLYGRNLSELLSFIFLSVDDYMLNKMNLRDDLVEVVYPKAKNLSNEETLKVLSTVQDAIINFNEMAYLQFAEDGSYFDVNLFAKKQEGLSDFSKFGVDDQDFMEDDGESSLEYMVILNYFFPSVFMGKEEIASLEKVVDVPIYQDKGFNMAGGIDYLNGEEIFVKSATDREIVMFTKFVLGGEMPFTAKISFVANKDLTGCSSCTGYYSTEGMFGRAYFEFDENNAFSYYNIIMAGPGDSDGYQFAFMEFNFAAGKMYMPQDALPENVEKAVKEVFNDDLISEMQNYPSQYEELTAGKEKVKVSVFPDDLKENERQLSDDEIKSVLSPFFDFAKKCEADDPQIFVEKDANILQDFSKVNFSDSEFKDLEKRETIFSEDTYGMKMISVFERDVLGATDLINTKFYSFIDLLKEPLQNEEKSMKFMITKASDKEIILNVYGSYSSYYETIATIRINCNEDLSGFTYFKYMACVIGGFVLHINVYFNDDQKMTHMIVGGEEGSSSQSKFSVMEENYLADKVYEGTLEGAGAGEEGFSTITKEQLKNTFGIFGNNLSDFISIGWFNGSDDSFYAKAGLKEQSIEVAYPYVETKDLTKEETMAVFETIKDVASEYEEYVYSSEGNHENIYSDLPHFSGTWERYSYIDNYNTSYSQLKSEEAKTLVKGQYFKNFFNIVENILMFYDKMQSEEVIKNINFHTNKDIHFEDNDCTMYIKEATNKKVVVYLTIKEGEKTLYYCVTIKLKDSKITEIALNYMTNDDVETFIETKLVFDTEVKVVDLYFMSCCPSMIGDDIFTDIGVFYEANVALNGYCENAADGYDAKYVFGSNYKKTNEIKLYPATFEDDSAGKKTIEVLFEDRSPDENDLSNEELASVLERLNTLTSQIGQEEYLYEIDGIFATSTGVASNFSNCGIDDGQFKDNPSKQGHNVYKLNLLNPFISYIKTFEGEIKEKVFVSKYDGLNTNTTDFERFTKLYIEKATDKEVVIYLYYDANYKNYVKIVLSLSNKKMTKLTLSKSADDKLYNAILDVDDNFKITHLLSFDTDNSDIKVYEANYLANKYTSAEDGSFGSLNEAHKKAYDEMFGKHHLKFFFIKDIEEKIEKNISSLTSEQVEERDLTRDEIFNVFSMSQLDLTKSSATGSFVDENSKLGIPYEEFQENYDGQGGIDSQLEEIRLVLNSLPLDLRSNIVNQIDILYIHFIGTFSGGFTDIYIKEATLSKIVCYFVSSLSGLYAEITVLPNAKLDGYLELEIKEFLSDDILRYVKTFYNEQKELTYAQILYENIGTTKQGEKTIKELIVTENVEYIKTLTDTSSNQNFDKAWKNVFGQSNEVYDLIENFANEIPLKWQKINIVEVLRESDLSSEKTLELMAKVADLFRKDERSFDVNDLIAPKDDLDHGETAPSGLSYTKMKDIDLGSYEYTYGFGDFYLAYEMIKDQEHILNFYYGGDVTDGQGSVHIVVSKMEKTGIVLNYAVKIQDMVLSAIRITIYPNEALGSISKVEIETSYLSTNCFYDVYKFNDEMQVTYKASANSSSDSILTYEYDFLAGKYFSQYEADRNDETNSELYNLLVGSNGEKMNEIKELCNTLPLLYKYMTLNEVDTSVFDSSSKSNKEENVKDIFRKINSTYEISQKEYTSSTSPLGIDMSEFEENTRSFSRTDASTILEIIGAYSKVFSLNKDIKEIRYKVQTNISGYNYTITDFYCESWETSDYGPLIIKLNICCSRGGLNEDYVCFITSNSDYTGFSRIEAYCLDRSSVEVNIIEANDEGEVWHVVYFYGDTSGSRNSLIEYIYQQDQLSSKVGLSKLIYNADGYENFDKIWDNYFYKNNQKLTSFVNEVSNFENTWKNDLDPSKVVTTY